MPKDNKQSHRIVQRLMPVFLDFCQELDSILNDVKSDCQKHGSKPDELIIPDDWLSGSDDKIDIDLSAIRGALARITASDSNFKALQLPQELLERFAAKLVDRKVKTAQVLKWLNGELANNGEGKRMSRNAAYRFADRLQREHKAVLNALSKKIAKQG